MRALAAGREALRNAGAAVEDFWFAPADPRAYAGLRIGYGIAALAVLLDLWPERTALLSSSGMFGGASLSSLAPNVFLLARSEAAVTAVALAAGAAMVCLVLGVLPRAAALVVYLWTVGVGTTAPTAQSGFDTILRVVGFVVLIGPQVRTWGIGKRGAEELPPPPVWGLRLVQWQLMLIYVSTVWLKAPDPFWRNGEAVSYFTMSMFARFPTAAFSHLPALGAFLTFSTLLIEATVPFLLWLPRARWLGLFLGASLHLGIALSSKLALFTLTILPLYLAFFERQDFDRVRSLFARAPE